MSAPRSGKGAAGLFPDRRRPRTFNTKLSLPSRTLEERAANPSVQNGEPICWEWGQSRARIASYTSTYNPLSSYSLPRLVSSLAVSLVSSFVSSRVDRRVDHLVDFLVDHRVDRQVAHRVDHLVDPLVVNPVVLHRNSTLLVRNWAICINEHSAEEIPQLLSQIQNGSNLARRPQKGLSDRPSIPTRIATYHEVIYEVIHVAIHAVIYEVIHVAIHAVIYEAVHEVIHVAMPTVLHAAWRYATRRFPSARLPTCPYPLLAADTRPPNQERCGCSIRTVQVRTP